MRTLIILFLLFVQVSYGQDSAVLTGRVVDEATEEGVIGALVKVDHSHTVVTDLDGLFEFVLPVGTHKLELQHIAYQTKLLNVILNSDTTIVCLVSANAYNVDEVEVTSSNKPKGISGILGGRVDLNMESLKILPKFLGNNDPLRILQLTPGVQTTNDGESGMFIRGGESGHNLTIWNDAPIYNASHLLGTFSIFNAGHVGEFKLSKSNIGAEYGGRLSAIISVESPDEIPDKVSVSGSLGIIASQATLDAPIGKKNALYLSARKTYVGLILEPVLRSTMKGKGGDIPYGYEFQDVNFTFISKPTTKDKIIVNGYWGADQLEVGEPSYDMDGEVEWSNLATSLQWKRSINDDVDMKHSIFASSYINGVDVEQGDISFKLPSSIFDVGYHNSFDFKLGEHKLKVGMDYIHHSISPQTPRVKIESFEIGSEDPAKLHTNEIGVYMSDRFNITSDLWTEVGIRYSGNIHNGEYDDLKYNSQGMLIDSIHYKKGEIVSYNQGWEPRIALNYTLPRQGLLQFSYNRLYQYIHLVSISGVGLPTDFWTPASKNIPPQRSDNFSVGYFQSLNQGAYELSVEGYYRRMNGLIEYDNAIIDLLNQKYILEESLLYGKGEAYGLEVMVKKNGKKWNGWISYTLGRSKRKFPDIESGNVFPAKHDRRHDLSIVVSYAPNKKWDFSTVFVYASGSAYTEPTGLHMIGGNPIKEYGPYNGARLPNYHRLDISANYWFFREKGRESGLNFSLYNMYRAQNPLYIFVVANYQNDKLGIERKYKQLYDIIPSISWTFKF